MNIDMPIRIDGINISGFNLHLALQGESVLVKTLVKFVSDDPLFHAAIYDINKIVSGKIGAIIPQFSLDRCSEFLILIHSDDSADVWLDFIPKSFNARINRQLEANSPIYDKDIIDIIGYDFPGLQIKEEDRLIYCFRVGWKFGFFADFNPSSKFDRVRMSTEIASIYRKIRYHKLYDSINSNEHLNEIIKLGWFPFIEIIGAEYESLVAEYERCGILDKAEIFIANAFDDQRIDNMHKRWIENKYIAAKRIILKSSTDAYKRGDHVACIKIIFTEIEGILEGFYQEKNQKPSQNIEQLLSFVRNSVTQTSKTNESLYFPKLFKKYLVVNTFANFSRQNADVVRPSRHSVSHGALVDEDYTKIRALQAILAFDQIVYYISG